MKPAPPPPELGLNVLHPRQQNTPRLPTWQDPQVQAPLFDRPFPSCPPEEGRFRNPGQAWVAAPSQKLITRGKGLLHPVKIKWSIFHTGGRDGGFALLQVITLASDKEPKWPANQQISYNLFPKIWTQTASVPPPCSIYSMISPKKKQMCGPLGKSGDSESTACWEKAVHLVMENCGLAFRPRADRTGWHLGRLLNS